MPDDMVQISAAELNVLRRADAFLGNMVNDTEIGEALQKKAKVAFPQARFTADIAAPIVEPIKAELKKSNDTITALQKRLDDREKQESEKTEMDALNATLASARSKYKLTDEGMEKVIKRMREMNNPDAESAAAWVTDHEPRTTPTPASSYTPQALNLFGAGEKSDDAKIQLLHKDPLKFFDREVADILDEFASGKAA